MGAFRINFTAPSTNGAPGGSLILDRIMAFVAKAFAKIEAAVGVVNGIAPLDAVGLIDTSFEGTGEPDATTVLYGDRAWRTPPSVLTSGLAPATSQVIAANTGAVIPRSYKILSGLKLSVALGGRVRIL